MKVTESRDHLFRQNWNQNCRSENRRTAQEEQNVCPFPGVQTGSHIGGPNAVAGRA